jgi:hypothetical protein
VGSVRHVTVTYRSHLMRLDLLAAFADIDRPSTLPAWQDVEVIPAPAASVFVSATVRRRRTKISPQRLTGLAVLIAGRQRAAVSGEWQSHLAGETGAGLPEDRQLRDAAGFMCAAVRYRFHDVADLLWRPVDALLASRELSSLFVLLATLGVSVFFIREGRLYGLADHLEDVAVVAGFAYWLIRVGRWWRDVKPPERKPRRKSE